MPKLYIGNLSYSIYHTRTLRHFSRGWERLKAPPLSADKFSGRSKGFGFVEMADSNDAAAAIESLNESEFQGRRIKVAEARSGDQRGNGDGGKAVVATADAAHAPAAAMVEDAAAIAAGKHQCGRCDGGGGRRLASAIVSSLLPAVRPAGSQAQGLPKTATPGPSRTLRSGRTCEWDS